VKERNNEVFNKIRILLIGKQSNEINVFLCGRDSASKDSLRDTINKRLHKYPNLNILYPEWLFQNLIVQTDYDLISLEMKLAKDVDKIILPLEGIGAFCELGSFVMNPIIRGKLVVINDEKYINKKTFVNLGPLKLIKKSDLGEVFYTDIEKHEVIADLVEKKLKNIHSTNSKENDFSNLFSLTYLVGLFILVYQPITKGYLEYLIRQFDKSIDIRLIDPAIEFLIKKLQINSQQNEKNEEIFSMTKKGDDDYIMSFLYISKIKIYYRIRSIALCTKLRKQYNFSPIKEKARLLDNTK